MTGPAYLSRNAINWYNLINAGRSLLNPQRDGNPPTEEHIRRAISSAYYALFHALVPFPDRFVIIREGSHTGV